MTEIQPTGAPPVPPAPAAAPAVKSSRDKGKKRWLLVAAAVALVAWLFWPDHHNPPTTYFDASGFIELDNPSIFQEYGTDCAGIGDYQDAKVGTPIIIDGGANHAPLATGSVTLSQIVPNFNENHDVCMLTFQVKHVPSGWQSYSIFTPLDRVDGYTEQSLKAGPIVRSGG